MDFIEQIRELDLDILTKLVRDAKKSESLEICDWQVAPLDFEIAMPTTGGLYRVYGTANSFGMITEWSLICKIVINDKGEGLDDPKSPYYWKREALVYKSGLLSNLDSELTLPQCYGVFEHSGADWIWLEEILADEEWTPEHYRYAARSIGQFNGSYVNSDTLSAYPWLSRNWLQMRLYDSTTFDQRLFDLEQRQSPLADVFSILPANRLRQLYNQRESYIRTLNSLPQTLCHRDFTRSNVMFRRNAEDGKKMVVIDWSFVGSGVLGEDIGHFFAATLFGFQYRLEKASELDDLLWAGYFAGLEDAGWQGDPQDVRYSSAISTTLCWSGLWLEWLPYILREDLQGWFEAKYQHSIDDILERWNRTLMFLLDRVEKI